MKRKFAGISLENTLIMGVLNLSPKTFYKKSRVEGTEETANRAEKMVEEGAQIIDLGAMSTGPEVKPIPTEEEIKMLLPALKRVAEKIDVPISIDTQRSKIAEKSLKLGAEIINDVSGFKADPRMPDVVSKHDCHAILMANRISGRVRTAEKESNDIKTMDSVKKALSESLSICRQHNINLNKIAIDPSIGFGRNKDWDLKIVARLEKLREFERPICVGISRKSFIGNVLGLKKPSDRLAGSLGATAIALIKGANIIRTHDPLETSHLVRIIEAIQREED